MTERSEIVKKGIDITQEYGKMGSKNLDNLIKSFDEMPLFLSVEDVSLVFNIGRNSTYNLFNSAEFPTIKIAGQFRICKDDLIGWLQKQKYQRK